MIRTMPRKNTRRAREFEEKEEMLSFSSVRYSRHGFTLIEMLVVILLIAIMASIIVPNYSHFRDKNLFQFVVRAVRDKFAEAREKAVENATTANVVYDPQSETFTVQVTPSPPPADQPVALQTDANANAGAASALLPDTNPVSLGTEVNIANFITGGNSTDTSRGNAKTIQFRPDGTCDGATLTIVGRNGYAEQITILPSTGRAVIEEATPNQ